MKFTDIFVQRPVLSLVLSMLILVLGFRAIFQLPITQYPADRERDRHSLDDLLRCGRRHGRGFHHPTARAGNRTGTGYRLPVFFEQHRLVGHYRDAAVEL